MPKKVRRNILYISKDVLRRDYIRIYNPNSTFQTPNIDKLAKSGTLFENYYCSSPSSGMAATCFASGLSAYQLDRKTFQEVEDFSQTLTLFNELESEGIETHVIWSKEFEHLAYAHSKVFDKSTKNHYAPSGGSKSVRPQKHAFDKIESLDNKNQEYDLADYFYKYIKNIQERSANPWFIWCHCPHVFLPYQSYGADIEHFDNFIGRLSDNIDADIIISADHGHFNCEKGKLVYGFDVYDPASRIPLITPNYFGENNIKYPVEQSQLKEIILTRKLSKREFIYCDTAYYAQPHRVLMIRKDNYKYIYNKEDKSEELYDLDFDPNENINLLVDKWPCFDRQSYYDLDEVVFYDRWNEAKEYFNILKSERTKIWRDAGVVKNFLYKYFTRLSRKRSLFSKFKKNTLSVKGRWGCQKARVRGF